MVFDLSVFLLLTLPVLYIPQVVSLTPLRSLRRVASLSATLLHCAVTARQSGNYTSTAGRSQRQPKMMTSFTSMKKLFVQSEAQVDDRSPCIEDKKREESK